MLGRFGWMVYRACLASAQLGGACRAPKFYRNIWLVQGMYRPAGFQDSGGFEQECWEYIPFQRECDMPRKPIVSPLTNLTWNLM